MNEAFSAFLDGEASRDESESVLAAMFRDDALRDSWSRQHFIRTTLRAHSSEVAVAPDLAFSQRVMNAIAEDGHRETVSSVTTLDTARRASARPRRWRGMAGMGMAAAVAGIVLFSGNPFLRSGGSGSDSRVAANDGESATVRTSRMASTDASDDAADAGFGHGDWNDRLADFSTVATDNPTVRHVASSMGSAAGISSARASSGMTRTASADHWSTEDPAVRDELNGYLVDHNGMASGYGMSSTTPGYVRVATYGQGAAQ